jgi:excisionase family DNA binding protein
MSEEKWLTVAEAAQRAGYHPEHIRRLIRNGDLRARKYANLVWQVDSDSLDEYSKQRESDGTKGRAKKK